MLVLQGSESDYYGLFRKFALVDVFEIAKVKEDVDKLNQLQEFDFLTIWASSGE